MTKHDVCNEYFMWLYDLVCSGRYFKTISYDKLFSLLHNTEFVYTIPKDANRAENGIELRYHFACEHPEIKDADLYLDGPCSVLEMMVALSVHCEEDFMDDPRVGNRTGQWFWCMITNLGLGTLYDSKFDEDYAIRVINRFLNRDYEPNGKGGLFYIRNCDIDLRDVEIYHQMCLYINSIS